MEATRSPVRKKQRLAKLWYSTCLAIKGVSGLGVITSRACIEVLTENLSRCHGSR